ncbi:MAG: hypothetical protein KAI96_05885 [Thermodesulfovibrionia bacterium]|nr:hypothetical protein [Thermodesulfovibrionia bacterium]
MLEKRFGQWNINISDLDDLSPIKVRDFIIECLYKAEKETFLRIKDKLNISSNEKEIREYIKTRVKIAFDTVGGNFEHPTKESLSNVAVVIAKMSTLFGTPKNVIEFHKGQMQRLIKALHFTGNSFRIDGE